MALTRSFPTQHASGLSITDTRRVTAGLVVRNADGTPRAGVFPSHMNALVTGRSTAPLMAYDVAPFLAATSRVNTGVELVANDAVMTVVTTAAPASNSRIDVIWVRAQFVQHGDANNDVVLGVTQGAPALTPVKPAIPAGALELATAEVLSTTTQTSTVVITPSYPCTASAGGVVPFRTLTDLAAWAAPDGALARDAATGARYERFGGSWSSIQTGVHLILPTSVSGTGLALSGGEVVATAMPAAGGFIEGIFSSRYRHYEIEVEGTFASSAALQIRLRNSGGTASGVSDYLNQYMYATGSGASSAVQNNLSLFSLSASLGDRLTAHLRFTNPAQAVATGYLASTASRVANTVTQTSMGGFHNPAVAYTGIEVSTSGAAFTGTIKVYGIA